MEKLCNKTSTSAFWVHFFVTKPQAHLAFRKAALRSSVALSLLVHFVPCGGRLRRCSTPWGHGVKKNSKISEKKFKKTKKDVDTFLEEVYILIHRRNSKLRESNKEEFFDRSGKETNNKDSFQKLQHFCSLCQN